MRAHVKWVVLIVADLMVFGAFGQMSLPVVASGLPGLSVVGNHLEAAGHRIQLRGVNRSGTEYSCVHGTGIFDGPSDDASIAAIASWHTNAVRLGLNEDCWLGINGEPTGGISAQQYRGAIQQYVARLHDHGQYAILELHWSAPGTFQATSQEGMADAAHSPAMWSSVARAFSNDPATIFDLFNEPVGISWPCWRAGCLYGGDTSSGRGQWQTAGMQSLVEAVRNAGARNVIMLGGLSFANDLSAWLDYQPSDPAHQLVASFHTYDFNTCNTEECWSRTAAPVAARVPLVMGEIGQKSCAADFIDRAMGWADAKKIGYLAWVWDTWGGCGSVLITDYAGTPTPGYGEGYRAHLAALRPAPATANSDVPSNAPRDLAPVAVAALVALGLIVSGILIVLSRRRVRPSR